MALTQSLIDILRVEIGNDQDVVDNITDETATTLGSLEGFYTNTSLGNSSVLRTALVVWRKRLADWQSHAFDVATEGALINRSQKTRFLKGQVARYELLIDTTSKAAIEAVETPDSETTDSEYV